jgi:hypothetical protein
VSKIIRMLFPLATAILLMGISFSPVFAEPDEPGIGNETCLNCHGQPGLSLTLENGESLPLHVDRETYNDSVHGAAGYACVQCHTEVGDFPHSEFSADSRRDAAVQLYSSCQRCHSGEYQRAGDSAHSEAIEAGNLEAAICTDCHGAHSAKRLTNRETGEILAEARTEIPLTCALCHNLIYEKYRASVHGSALIDEGNTDVPTCIDCHGVHAIGEASTAAFRLDSPSICADCHTDPEIMDPYGISTEVLDTYVADFHGTTVTLFEQRSPDADSNKPVCFDCHGVHDILSVDDPEKGLAVQENLLSRCQVCHPDATSNFSSAWMSHYIPSEEKNPMVYYINLFYDFFIPGVLGGMGVLVLLDFSWQVRSRITKRRNKTKSNDQTTQANGSSKQVQKGSDSGKSEPETDTMKQTPASEQQSAAADMGNETTND